MRVLNIRAVLHREKNIQQAGPKTKVLEELDDRTAKYVILSHRWGTEVDYDDMTGLMKMDEQDREEVRGRDGYQKIIRSCEQAKKDGYMWLWVDTCCIDKRSSAELSEAINSMYRWYQNSQRCYVYLGDVDDSAFPTKQDFTRPGWVNGWPEWFSRGWTLQELIAPAALEFFNKNWVSIGRKQDLTAALKDITQIPEEVLKDAGVLVSGSTTSGERPLVAHIMSWAADRRTTRIEDRAYSLMGLFDVNMPMLYGEGSKAFQRLQLEIIRVSSDHSIFAWNPNRQLGEWSSVLAADPSCFQGRHDIERVDSSRLVEEVNVYMRKNDELDNGRRNTRRWNIGRRRTHTREWAVDFLKLSMFNVTNVGIQVSLPVVLQSNFGPNPDSASDIYSPRPFILPLSPVSTLASPTPPPSPTPPLSPIISPSPIIPPLPITPPPALVVPPSPISPSTTPTSTRASPSPPPPVSPPLPFRSQSQFSKAMLPCLDRSGNLITLNLVSRGLNHGRSFETVRVTNNSEPRFTSLYLAYIRGNEESYRDLRLDDTCALRYGFIRHGTFPCEITDGIVKLSQGNNLIILVYANDNATCRFAVGLGCSLGKVWTRVVCDESSAKQEPWLSWADFARQVYGILWDVPISEGNYATRNPIVNDAHLSQSIWNARVVCSRSTGSLTFTDVMIDIVQCPGCCTGPLECTYTSVADKPWLPWRSKRVASHTLTIDGKDTEFDKCSGQEIALGDYGDSSYGNFKRCGNIFEHMRELGFDPTDCVYRPFVSYVSYHPSSTDPGSMPMMLHQPSGLSLPNTEGIRLLLNALSTRLAGKLLVTTVIECSAFDKDDGKETLQRKRRSWLKWKWRWKWRRGRGRRDVGSDSPSKDGNQPADQSSFIPFCIIAKPLAWHREPACEQRRKQFNEIRVHFFDSVLYRFAGTGAHRIPVDNWATQIIWDIFGLEPLKNWLGKITLFERLPSAMGSRRATPLLKKCTKLGGGSLYDKRQTQSEVKDISRTLSFGLLEHIRATLLDVSEGIQQTGQVDPITYDMAGVPSSVQEIEALQATLQTTEDEDEQLALEEDITGKILWLHWRGIYSEVSQRLATVASSEVTLDVPTREGAREIAEIIKRTPRVELDDDMAHLQRIMLDARAGISKYESWLAARAAGQTVLSRDNNNYTIDCSANTG